MKKTYFLVCLLILAGLSNRTSAQTDPGTTHLKHQWTFDNGSATDDIGGITGTIVGDGKLSNNAFVSTNAYMSFPASQIGINNYSELTVEIWCTSSAAKNTGWTMLSYFGETGGSKYTFLSIARAVDGSMAALETSAWNGVTGAEYDDGKLHHFVYTVSATTITYFIDGVLIGSNPLTTGNSLANVGTSLAYLGRGGWTADPNWIGSFQKFSIYDKALTTDEVLFLYQGGAEKQAVVSTTATSLAFDNNYLVETFNVTGANLSAPITITAPAGISITNLVGSTISSLPANATDQLVVAIWDAKTPVNGTISFSSGNTVANIPVKTAVDLSCFTPLYTDVNNIVEDMGLNDLAKFPGGWGTRSVVNIINNPENVYCGASSMKIGDGVAISSGSLNIELTGKINPSTTYRVKAMIKTIGGTFQLGVLGWDATQGDLNFPINTNGQWKALDTTFTTGASMGSTQWMFINNYTCTGTLAYVDNWEMYAVPDASINTSVSTIAFDPQYLSKAFMVTSANLSSDITLTAPTGLTLSKHILPATASGDTVQVTYDGITTLKDSIRLTSGSLVVKIPVQSTTVSNSTCFNPLYSNKVNLIPDPYLNDITDFGGWGTRSLISIIDHPDSVYCGSHSGRIVGSGSMDVILTRKMKSNTTYKARAMIRTFGGYFQIGINGIDTVHTADVTDSINTQGSWLPMTFEFTTADLGKAQDMFINNYGRSGKRAFIDNWELYEVAVNAVPLVNVRTAKLYVQNGRMIADFDLNQTSKVGFAVYNVQGKILSNDTFTGNAGKTVKVLSANAGPGVYIVKMTVDGQSTYLKIIK